VGETPGPARPVFEGARQTAQGTIVGSFSRVGLPAPPGETALAVAAASGRAGGHRDGRFIRNRPDSRAGTGGPRRRGMGRGRDRDRTEQVAGAIRSAGSRAERALLDVGDGAAVDAFVDRFASRHERLVGLVHVAGALLAHYVSAEGFELTVATHVLGPHRLTWRLAPDLRCGGRSSIVTVSSGSTYTERFDLDRLEIDPPHYDGARAYCRAKRAQVVLVHGWSRSWSAWGVASYTVPRGWVDTPGLANGRLRSAASVRWSGGPRRVPTRRSGSSPVRRDRLRRQGCPLHCRSRTGSGTTDASAASATCLGQDPATGTRKKAADCGTSAPRRTGLGSD
jgi:NAD(P)-dependent dehydrogenase (short-subunit alcohol dehydrogenase family)